MVGSRHEEEQRKAMWDSALLKLAAVSNVRQSQRRKKKTHRKKDSLETSFIFGNTIFMKFIFRKVSFGFLFFPAAPFPHKAEFWLMSTFPSPGDVTSTSSLRKTDTWGENSQKEDRQFQIGFKPVLVSNTWAPGAVCVSSPGASPGSRDPLPRGMSSPGAAQGAGGPQVPTTQGAEDTWLPETVVSPPSFWWGKSSGTCCYSNSFA